jgi:hypothetical protein
VVILGIPKSQDNNTFALEKSCPFLIERFLACKIATTAIKLDCETRLRAVKIEYVRLDRMLPPKFPTLQMPIAKLTPQESFLRSRILPKVASPAHC